MAFGREVLLEIGPQGAAGRELSALYTSFEVNKTDKPSNNTAKITVYNMGSETYKKYCREGYHLILKAGYTDEEGPMPIFFGTITAAFRKRATPDFTIELEALDGHYNINTRQVSLSFAGKTPASIVLNQLTSLFALPVRGLDKIDTSIQYATGFSFIGKARAAMDAVVKKLGLSWTIQNEEIMLLLPGEQASLTAVSLTYDTGLLTSPQLATDSSDKATAKEVRYKLQTALNPRLIPGALISVTSPTFSGLLKIRSVKMSGDNFGGDFTCEVEGVAL